MEASARPRVLFLCTGNSCRSQMAEGWARSLHAGRIEVCSAGTSPHGLNPLAVRAMLEAGVDISAHTSKPIEACDPASIDLVVTVCGHAAENCPVWPGDAVVVHRRFDDPPQLAREAGEIDDDEAMKFYRRVRDEIRDYVQELPRVLADSGVRV